nr:7606_t:CDS:2 [Entrophospora candida]
MLHLASNSLKKQRFKQFTIQFIPQNYRSSQIQTNANTTNPYVNFDNLPKAGIFNPNYLKKVSVLPFKYDLDQCSKEALKERSYKNLSTAKIYMPCWYYSMLICVKFICYETNRAAILYEGEAHILTSEIPSCVMGNLHAFQLGHTIRIYQKLIEKVTLGRLISTVFPKIKSLKPKYNFDWIKDLQPISPQIFAEIDVVDFTYNLPYFTRLLFDHSKDKFKKIKSMTIDDFVMDVEKIDVEFQQFFPVYHPVYVFTEASPTDKSYQVVDAYNCQLIDPSVSHFDSIKYSLGFGLPDRFLFGAYFLNMLDKIDDNFNDIVTNAENHYMLPINWDLGIIQPFRERFEANQQFLEIVEKYYGLLSELKALYYNNGSYKPSHCRNFDDWISYINTTNGWKEIYKKLKIPSDLPSLSVFSQYFYTVKSGFFQSVNASGIKEKLHKFDHKFSLKNKFPGSTSTPYPGVNLGRVNLDGVNSGRVNLDGVNPVIDIATKNITPSSSSSSPFSSKTQKSGPIISDPKGYYKILKIDLSLYRTIPEDLVIELNFKKTYAEILQQSNDPNITDEEKQKKTEQLRKILEARNKLKTSELRVKYSELKLNWKF